MMVDALIVIGTSLVSVIVYQFLDLSLNYLGRRKLGRRRSGKC